MITGVLVAAAGIISAALMSACTAHADPPQFPDLDGYTPVNVHDYENEERSPGESNTRVDFLSPDGIRCGFHKPQGAGCTGNEFPNIPPQPWNPSAGITGVNTISTNSGLSATNAPFSSDNKVQGHPIKTLPPLHSIAVNGVICGVDDKGMTACKDPQGRGFILSPSWSGWLPHV